MLDDHSYVDRLRAIFAANDPADGIDREDGFGTEVRVADLRQVPGEHGAELEVEYELDVPPRLRPEVSSRGSTRVEFGEEWRRLSGFEDPADYAPTIAKHVWFAAGRQVQQGRDEPSPSRDEVDATVPGKDVLFERLLTELTESGEVELVEPGAIRIDEHLGGAQPVEIRVTPSQWREYVVGCEMNAWTDSGVDAWDPGDGFGMALLFLDEMIGSRYEDEHFVVFYRDDFERSVRSELPPVRGHDV